MGVYTCAVSAWGVNGQGELVKLAEQQSAPHTVRWIAKRKDTLFLYFFVVIQILYFSLIIDFLFFTLVASLFIVYHEALFFHIQVEAKCVCAQVKIYTYLSEGRFFFLK